MASEKYRQLTKGGGLTIPRLLRQEMGIHPGDPLEISTTSEGALVVKKHRPSCHICGSTKYIATYTEGIGRYIEVFGGAGWVLFGKEVVAGQMEVFNDLDGELINLYRCVKYHSDALQAELEWLLDSREIFFDFVEQRTMRGLTDIQRAARYLYCLKTSFGSDQRTFATAPKCIDHTKEYLDKVRKRLKGVVIEHRDFEPLIKTYDRKDALFYLDPPYVGTEKYYNVVFTPEDHQRLAALLRGIKGRFILSYDDNPMIRELYSWCNVDGVVRNTTLAGNSDNKVPFAEVIVKNF